MSHELRTPLNAIIGFSEVLLERHVRRAQREAGRLPEGHPLVRQAPAHAHQRHPRPVEGRGRAHGARALRRSTCRRAHRERDDAGPRARAAARHRARARRRPARSARSSPTSASSSRSCSTCCPTRSSSRPTAAGSTCSARRDGDDVEVAVQRHRHRHRAGGPGGGVRGIPPGRPRLHEQAGRHGARPRAHAALRRAARRHASGSKASPARARRSPSRLPMRQRCAHEH